MQLVVRAALGMAERPGLHAALREETGFGAKLAACKFGYFYIVNAMFLHAFIGECKQYPSVVTFAIGEQVDPIPHLTINELLFAVSGSVAIVDWVIYFAFNRNGMSRNLLILVLNLLCYVVGVFVNFFGSLLVFRASAYFHWVWLGKLLVGYLDRPFDIWYWWVRVPYEEELSGICNYSLLAYTTLFAMINTVCILSTRMVMEQAAAPPG